MATLFILIFGTYKKNENFGCHGNKKRDNFGCHGNHFYCIFGRYKKMKKIMRRGHVRLIVRRGQVPP